MSQIKFKGLPSSEYNLLSRPLPQPLFFSEGCQATEVTPSAHHQDVIEVHQEAGAPRGSLSLSLHLSQNS